MTKMTKNVDAPPANALQGIGTKIISCTQGSFIPTHLTLFERISKTKSPPTQTPLVEYTHTMSNIAARILAKPRACKDPPPAACVESREARDVGIAEESSKYHWIEFNFVVVGFPHEKDIQDFQELLRRAPHKTVKHVQMRDAIISRFLPALLADGLVPRYSAKFVLELYCYFLYVDDNHEMHNFWWDYHNPRDLSIERTNAQNKFIARKHSEREENKAEREWSSYKNEH